MCFFFGDHVFEKAVLPKSKQKQTNRKENIKYKSILLLLNNKQTIKILLTYRFFIHTCLLHAFIISLVNILLLFYFTFYQLNVNSIFCTMVK